MKHFLHRIYNSLPYKGRFYNILRTFWSPKEPIYKHLHFKGIIDIDVEKGKSFKMMHFGFQLENEIYWAGLTGGWEKESIKIWIRLCALSNSVLDIGANTGLYSLIAKTVQPSSVVYAFEPVKRVFEKLNQNIKLNGFDIVSVEKATSNVDGTAMIYDQKSEHIYSVTVNKNLQDKNTEVIETEISTLRLDTFIEDHQITNIDLIKLDVETHEPEVLEGFIINLKKFKPTFLIEILNDEVGRRIHEIVKDMNYLYYNIDERGSIRKVDTITRSDYYNYLFCNNEIANKLGLEV